MWIIAAVCQGTMSLDFDVNYFDSCLQTKRNPQSELCNAFAGPGFVLHVCLGTPIRWRVLRRGQGVMGGERGIRDEGKRRTGGWDQGQCMLRVAAAGPVVCAVLVAAVGNA